jgi:putative endonuclease
VARRRGVLVFVEVKARVRVDDAVEAVTERSKRRIINAAELWRAGHPDHANGEIRFDVIAVTPRKMPRHMVHAFDASA